MRKIKVLWLAPLRPVPWISTLAEELAKNSNIDLTILKFNSSIKQNIESTRKNNINYIYLKKPRSRINIITLSLFPIGRLKKYLEKNIYKFDLIHIHGTEQRQFVSSYKLNIPQVLSIQGILTECKKFTPILDRRYLSWNIGSFYEKKYLKHIKNFSCRTHWDTNFVKNESPNAQIFHNWELIRPQFFSNHFSANKKSILFMGGTNILKGWREALMAFNIVKQQIDIKIIIVGHTNQKAITEFIKKRKLKNISSKDIIFKGQVNTDELIKTFDQSFCMVHPSYIDNSPNSVCESQVAGLPVIASDVGGVKSLIENGKTGLLVKIKPQEIADNVLKLYYDDNLFNEISSNSRALARKRHDPNTILSKTLQMYTEIIA